MKTNSKSLILSWKSSAVVAIGVGLCLGGFMFLRSKPLQPLTPASIPVTSSVPSTNKQNPGANYLYVLKAPRKSIDTLQMPEPIAILESADPYDHDLYDWFQAWQQHDPKITEISSHQKYVLNAILSQTKSPAIEIFEVGYAFYERSHDLPTANSFFLRAMEKEHGELADGQLDSKHIRSVFRMGELAKSLVWDNHEKYGESQAIDVLLLRYSDIIQFLSPVEENEEFANMRQHGFIGSIECLTLKGRLSEAIALAKSVDTDAMNEDQKVAFAWAYSYALQAGDAYSDAIPQLQIVADSPKSKYRQNAASTIIYLLAKLHRQEECSQKILAYTAQYGPLPQSIEAELSNMPR